MCIPLQLFIITFKSKESILSHNSLNHIHPCQICDKKFVKEKQLQKHSLLVHEGKESFQCNYCDKTLTRGVKLIKHESLIHAYECKICKKKYIWESLLKRHNFFTHGGSALFECNLCDKSFGSRSGLNRHNRNFHQDPFAM